MLSSFFNLPLLIAFTIAGLVASYFVFYRTNNVGLALGILYFALLEGLQVTEYFYVSPVLKSSSDPNCGGSYAMKYAAGLDQTMCDTYPNKILTLLTFVHICFQPYFIHLMNYSLTKNCLYKGTPNHFTRVSFLIGTPFIF